MDIVVKNVTKSYREDYKKKGIIGGIFLFAIGVILLIGCFLPVAKIGGVSIGNSFKVAIDFFKGAISKEVGLASHLGYFIVIPVLFILAVIIALISGIEAIKDKDSDSMFMDEKDLNLTITPKYIIKQVILFFVFTVVYILITQPTKIAAERFGFSFSLGWCVFLSCILLWVKGVICGYITLKYDEKGSFSKSEIVNRGKKGKKITKKEKTKVKKKTGKKPDSFFAGLYVLFAFLIVFLIAVGSAFVAFQYYNARFGGFNMMGHNSVAGWVVTPQEEGKLVFDEKTLSGGYVRGISGKDFGDYYIGLKENNMGGYESNTKTFTFYGDAYRYNRLKVEELVELRNTMWPEDDSQEALEKYAKTFQQLTDSINEIKSKIDSGRFAYERIAFVEGYMVDLQYNATGIDSVKWGEKAEGLSALFFREQIKLTNFYCNTEKSMDTFSVGTDFAKELIVARVQYNDGSVRISKITPTNIEELNTAKAGKHLLKWTDSWGTYETTITLY